MEKSVKEKYKEFKSRVTLDNVLSGEEQVELEKASSDERMELIVKNIAELAKKCGVPAETFKENSNSFELKEDKSSGKTKFKRLSKIESLAKKVNKEYEDKFPDAQKDGKNDKWRVHIHITKDFINQLKSEPDKDKKIAIAKDYILPQMKEQGLSDEQINKPISQCFHNGAPIKFRGGSLPLIEFISRYIVEELMKRYDKAHFNENESDFVRTRKFHRNTHKQNSANEKEPKDQVSKSADAINDMVTGGESVELGENQNGDVEQKGNIGEKKLEDMTPEEQIKYLQDLGMDNMLPPGLRNN